MIVISKTGKIGEIYEIQNIKIALPKEYDVVKFEGDRWRHTEYPKELSKIKSVFDWDEYPTNLKKNGMNILTKNLRDVKKVFGFITKTSLLILLVLITCTCSGPKLMLGSQTLGNQTDYSTYSGKLVKQTAGVMECAYLKNRRSGFSFMASGETVNMATISSDARFGILSKSGADAKKMFTDKVVPISVNYPFFFKPIQDGMDRPKTELAYRVPASKLTRSNHQSS